MPRLHGGDARSSGEVARVLDVLSRSKIRRDSDVLEPTRKDEEGPHVIVRELVGTRLDRVVGERRREEVDMRSLVRRDLGDPSADPRWDAGVGEVLGTEQLEGICAGSRSAESSLDVTATY